MFNAQGGFTLARDLTSAQTVGKGLPRNATWRDIREFTLNSHSPVHDEAWSFNSGRICAVTCCFAGWLKLFF